MQACSLQRSNQVQSRINEYKRGGAQPTWWGFADIHERLGDAEERLGFPLTPERLAVPSPFGTQGVFQRFEGEWDYPEDIDTNPVERCGASLTGSIGLLIFISGWLVVSDAPNAS